MVIGGLVSLFLVIIIGLVVVYVVFLFNVRFLVVLYVVWCWMYLFYWFWECFVGNDNWKIVVSSVCIVRFFIWKYGVYYGWFKMSIWVFLYCFGIWYGFIMDVWFLGVVRYCIIFLEVFYCCFFVSSLIYIKVMFVFVIEVILVWL